MGWGERERVICMLLYHFEVAVWDGFGFAVGVPGGLEHSLSLRGGSSGPEGEWEGLQGSGGGQSGVEKR